MKSQVKGHDEVMEPYTPLDEISRQAIIQDHSAERPVETPDPLFAKYWAKKGVDMSGFLSESKGNLANWPNAPGMNGPSRTMCACARPGRLCHSRRPER